MKRDLIKELKSDTNIFGECPECGESFPLRKAIMFYVDGPIPEEGKRVITEKENELKKLRKEVWEKRKKLKERSEKATVSVNLGKILEKVAPAIKGFKFDPRDCRTLFEPIDYLVFNRLTSQKGVIDSLYFLDIKTGGASLNERQRQIMKAVKEGKVEWDQYRGYI